MREQLFQGKYELPSYQNFVKSIGADYALLASSFFKALWHQYLLNKGSVSLPYWSNRFDDQQVFNQVLYSLSQAGYIESHAIPARNWAEANLIEDKLLQFVSSTELEQIRATYKFHKYHLKQDESTKSNLTRLNGKTTNTGLIREGFMKAGNTAFAYDTDFIANYYDVIKANTTKGMDKVRALIQNAGGQFVSDRATYDTVSVDVLDFHIHNPELTFTRGNNYSDSRGRAISSGLSKVFNPISNKDARSLLVIPE